MRKNRPDNYRILLGKGQGDSITIERRTLDAEAISEFAVRGALIARKGIIVQ